MRVNENGQYVSDDGFWVWDGAAWVPADGSSTPDSGAGASSEASGASAADHTDHTDQQSGGAEPVTAQADPVESVGSVDYASDTTAWSGGDFAEQGSLDSGDRVVPQVDNAHPMSPDNRHWWDGEKWIDVSTDATSLHTAGLSDDQAASQAHEQATSVPAETGWQGTDQELPVSETAAVSSYSEPEADTGISSFEDVQPLQVVQPVQASQPERQLSPDGMWEWNGSQWIPAEQQQAEPEPEPTPESVQPSRPERQLSPDGHWEWDGTAWVPAQKDDVAPVPAGAHVSPDGHWWWDGSQWLPTGR